MEPERVVAERTTCARHRNVETYLRCGKCGTPICPKCLVHTPVGARCPDCARPARLVGSRVGAVRYILSGAAGFGVGMLGGVILSVAPFGALIVLPLLLTGFLVGEAVSAASNRRMGSGLAILAFLCATLGPIAGRALLVAVAFPAISGAARVNLALNVAVQSLSGLELLLLLVAGVIATTRVQGR